MRSTQIDSLFQHFERCPQLAFRYRHRRIEFMVANGSTADMDGHAASTAPDPNDPEPPWGGARLLLRTQTIGPISLGANS